mmetsp:Transcript_35255/g.92793  ORF Transcript_35255/g.92793 Transcript_35255/m.92793 type:complete len:106 (+) Transcript_35255:182-499(+)
MVQSAGVVGGNGERVCVTEVRLLEVTEYVLLEQAEICQCIAGCAVITLKQQGSLVHPSGCIKFPTFVLKPAKIVCCLTPVGLDLKCLCIQSSSNVEFAFSVVQST